MDEGIWPWKSLEARNKISNLFSFSNPEKNEEEEVVK